MLSKSFKGSDNNFYFCLFDITETVILAGAMELPTIRRCLSHGYNVGWFSLQFFHILEIQVVCFVVVICGLVNNVGAIFHLPYLLTAS